MVRGLNALAVSRFTDNPNSTARRKCLHTAKARPMGIEPTSPEFLQVFYRS